MSFKVGDIVTRKSYNNDLVFKIIKIQENIFYLKGVNIRLYADSIESDLKRYSDDEDIEDEKEFLERIKPETLDRNDYFYLPGKILHIDGDNEYLNRCLKYYEDISILAMGINEKEKNIASRIRELLEECFGIDEDDEKLTGNNVTPDKIYYNQHIKTLIEMTNKKSS